MKHLKNHFKKIFQTAASIAIFTVLIIGTAKNTLPAKANTLANVHGAIWSFMPTDSDECIKGFSTSTNLPCVNGITGDNSNPFSGQGLGWAFLNSADNNPVDPIPYGVSLDIVTGALSGYAWSSDEGLHLGDLPGGFWIDFAPAGPYPQFSGITDGPARIEPSCFASTTTTTCPVIGWIRYMPGEITDSIITGDWDGWVSLNGVSTPPPFPYGVTYNKTDGTFIGDAWGDDVSGWIRFPRTLSTVHVEPIQCANSADKFAPPISYYPGQPIPADCTPALTCTDPAALNVGQPLPCTYDLCTNIGDVQTTLPWQNVNTLIWYTQYPNDPIGYCQKVAPGTCMDPSATNVGDPLPCKFKDDGGGTPVDPTTDLCTPPTANASGVQLGAGPWQVDGVWYGLPGGGVCAASVCPNYTDTYYATPPTGEVLLPNGSCGTTVDWCASNPCTPQPGGKPKPIYKEN